MTTEDRNENPADLLYTPAAAAVLGWTPRSMAVRRDAGRAPDPVAKAGARNIYRRGDLLAWLDARDAAQQRTTCTVPGCGRAARAGRNSMCLEHAARAVAGGDNASLTVLPRRPHTMPVADRLASLSYADPSTGCQLWVRHLDKGYGRLTIGGVRKLAHVAAFEEATGRRVNPELELDHECSRRSCIRIGTGHVVEVTHAENQRRAPHRAAARAAAFFADPASVMRGQGQVAA